MFRILIESHARVPITAWPTLDTSALQLPVAPATRHFGMTVQIAVLVFFCWKRTFLQVGKSLLVSVSPDRLFTVVKRNGFKEKELKQPQSEGPIIYLLSPMNAGCKSFCVKITPFSNF